MLKKLFAFHVVLLVSFCAEAVTETVTETLNGVEWTYAVRNGEATICDAIDTFESTATDGTFDFTVNVKDVAVGDGALEANIRKVFDIEGVHDLATEVFSADAVEVDAAVAEGGKVKFTVKPKCESRGQETNRPARFFFRVKMK